MQTGFWVSHYICVRVFWAGFLQGSSLSRVCDSLCVRPGGATATLFAQEARPQKEVVIPILPL